MHRTSLCTVFMQSARAAAAAPSSNALEPLLQIFWGWSSSWTRLLTCLVQCSSCWGSRRKLWRLRSCSSSTRWCPVIGPWWCRARCGATTDGCYSRCSLENPGHYFLTPFLTVPLRGVYASVMEAFGRISQHFLCEVYTEQFWIWCWRARRGATTGVLVQTVPKTVWRFRSCSSCCYGRRCDHAATSCGLASSGSASDSVQRADLWTYPARNRDRYAQCKLCSSQRGLPFLAERWR